MDLEKIILMYMREGYTQAEISEKLKAEGVFPNSLSIIEKTLKTIREKYGAKTNFHLACILYAASQKEATAEVVKVWANNNLTLGKVYPILRIEKNRYGVETFTIEDDRGNQKKYKMNNTQFKLRR